MTAPTPATPGLPSAVDGTDAAPLTGRRALVVTCSTRAATGVYPDRGGVMLVEALRRWGCDVPDATVVPDGPEVATALAAAIETGADLVLTTVDPGDHPPPVHQPRDPGRSGPAIDHLSVGVGQQQGDRQVAQVSTRAGHRLGRGPAQETVGVHVGVVRSRDRPVPQAEAGRAGPRRPDLRADRGGLRLLGPEPVEQLAHLSGR